MFALRADRTTPSTVSTVSGLGHGLPASARDPIQIDTGHAPDGPAFADATCATAPVPVATSST